MPSTLSLRSICFGAACAIAGVSCGCADPTQAEIEAWAETYCLGGEVQSYTLKYDENGCVVGFAWIQCDMSGTESPWP